MPQMLHVEMSPDGGWMLHRPNAPGTLSHHRTQEEAVAVGRDQLARLGGGELVIHGADGRTAWKARIVSGGQDALGPARVRAWTTASRQA
jgi:hypothetical protein